jgi:hypothetical protein
MATIISGLRAPSICSVTALGSQGSTVASIAALGTCHCWCCTCGGRRCSGCSGRYGRRSRSGSWQWGARSASRARASAFVWIRRTDIWRQHFEQIVCELDVACDVWVGTVSAVVRHAIKPWLGSRACLVDLHLRVCQLRYRRLDVAPHPCPFRNPLSIARVGQRNEALDQRVRVLLFHQPDKSLIRVHELLVRHASVDVVVGTEVDDHNICLPTIEVELLRASARMPEEVLTNPLLSHRTFRLRIRIHRDA